MTNQAEYMQDLTDRIDKMTFRSLIYKTLRTSLSKRGYWKNRPRGDGGNIDNFKIRKG